MSKELIERLREAAASRVASTAMIGADDLLAAADALESQVATPSSHWRAEGAPDPHAGHYDGERAALTMGKLTDDELANGAFMNYDQPLNLAGILAGTHASPIAWMTAVKDRIRWLSRSMEKSEARLHEVAVACATAEQERDALAASLKDVAVAVLEQVDLFGQRGEVCSFEGSSMIYAETLMELGDKVASVVERHSKDAGADNEARGDQTPTVEDINLLEWKGMDGACAWHLIDRHADDWSHVARLMNAWLEANREDLVAQLATAMRDAGEFAHQSMKAQDELKALREQEQKPVAEFRGTLGVGEKTVYLIEPKGPLTRGKALYAHPTTARELTDEAIENLHMQVYKGPSIAPARMLSFARAIERHLKGEGNV